MTRLNSQAVHDDMVRSQLRVFPHVGVAARGERALRGDGVNDDIEDGKTNGKANDAHDGKTSGKADEVATLSSLGVGERQWAWRRVLQWAWRQWSRPPARALSTELSPLLSCPSASPFRAFAWHRFQQRFAVAYKGKCMGHEGVCESEVGIYGCACAGVCCAVQCGGGGDGQELVRAHVLCLPHHIR